MFHRNQPLSRMIVAGAVPDGRRPGTNACLQVEFLKKAELREYEIERDKRLAGDVRLRNRL